MLSRGGTLTQRGLAENAAVLPVMVADCTVYGFDLPRAQSAQWTGGDATGKVRGKVFR